MTSRQRAALAGFAAVLLWSSLAVLSAGLLLAFGPAAPHWTQAAAALLLTGASPLIFGKEKGRARRPFPCGVEP
jgi:hypothetical protein